ncbi:conjugal transfer protein [Streptomyces sp. NPDC014685]|uniref:conjugal transfer protein n=1 Tax=Streptomyces sp. NPDC014685 TaxID=3364881 RepID=UPI0036FB7958
MAARGVVMRRGRAERARRPAGAGVDQELGEQGGWWTSPSTGAVAVATGVVRRLAWALLISGPVLGGWALVSQPGSDARPAPVAQSSSGDTAGPGGFAEMYVAAFLRAGEGSQNELGAFYSGAGDLELGGRPDAVQVGQIAAVRVKTVAPGRYWSVTVAARVLEPSPRASAGAGTGGGQPVIRMRFFQVPVEADRAGGPLAALALPAEVAAPAAGVPGATLAYGTPLPAQASDPAVETLKQFFAAYLSDGGELGRYLSPGTRLSPVRPAPYGSVAVTRVAVESAFRDGDGDGRIGAPAGREQLRLVVDVGAVRPDGVERPLSYALTLAGRDGRWEVAAVDATPKVTLPGAPAASPSGALPVQ